MRYISLELQITSFFHFKKFVIGFSTLILTTILKARM